MSFWFSYPESEPHGRAGYLSSINTNKTIDPGFFANAIGRVFGIRDLLLFDMRIDSEEGW